MKPIMSSGVPALYRNRSFAPRRLDRLGSAAIEFALTAPVVILIVTGIVDFGALMTQFVALTATTRIGAEYARLHPTDIAGIENTMQNSITFVPSLSFPSRFPLSCECNDATSISCTQSCAAAGRPGPNRVFITISANQAFSPRLPWPGLPTVLTASTQMRLQ
jgi:hypothetical protein